jgi:UDP-N-acetylmuramyl pentapeptide phosphotransferase/UDP-N-acetylglucosamine-1-phosphate transferase
MSDLDTALGAFALALSIAWITTPVAGRFAWRLGAIDRPRERGLHNIPTPRLGGVAILMAVLAAGLVFLDPTSETRAILGGALVIAVVGALDDVLRTKELVKVQLSKNADVKAKDVAYDLAAQVQAEVIQVIGRTVTLYRPNPEIKGKSGDLPPWRR